MKKILLASVAILVMHNITNAAPPMLKSECRDVPNVDGSVNRTCLAPGEAPVKQTGKVPPVSSVQVVPQQPVEPPQLPVAEGRGGGAPSPPSIYDQFFSTARQRIPTCQTQCWNRGGVRDCRQYCW